jgi:hypothetical protein
MPVSPVPVLFPLAVLCILIGGIVTAKVRHGSCRVSRHVAIAIALLVFPFIISQLKGLVVRQLASGGDPRWQLAYADWYFKERNLHQEIVFAPGIPWDEDFFFKYLSESAAQGNVAARRKYIAWIKGGSGTDPVDPDVQAAYDEYVRQLGDDPDYSYWRESTLLQRLAMLYAPLAILLQLASWQEESRSQSRVSQQLTRSQAAESAQNSA